LKIICLLLLIFLPNFSYSQSQYNFVLEELYSRGPSAKAEAMGKGFVANTENEFGSYYNPALSSLSEGLVINTSFSNRYEFYDNSRYNYWGVSYKIKNIVTVGLSRYYFNYGVDFYKSSAQEPYTSVLVGEISNTIYTVNFSREMMNDVYLGININSVTPNYLFNQSPKVPNKSATTFDIGILAKINISNLSPYTSQLIQFGAALYNINNVKYGYEYSFLGYTGYESYALPVILRFGSSYSMKYKRDYIIKNLNLVGFLAHLEMEDNSTSHYVLLKLGAEVTLLDIISFRGGYSIGNNFERSTNGKLNGDTYGIGLKIPLNLILKYNLPLSLTIDYVNLKPPPQRDSWNEGYYVFDRFNTISAKLNFVPNF
jgi:hypothetical protein